MSDDVSSCINTLRLRLGLTRRVDVQIYNSDVVLGGRVEEGTAYGRLPGWSTSS